MSLVKIDVYGCNANGSKKGFTSLRIFRNVSVDSLKPKEPGQVCSTLQLLLADDIDLSKSISRAI